MCRAQKRFLVRALILSGAAGRFLVILRSIGSLARIPGPGSFQRAEQSQLGWEGVLCSGGRRLAILRASSDMSAQEEQQSGSEGFAPDEDFLEADQEASTEIGEEQPTEEYSTEDEAPEEVCRRRLPVPLIASVSKLVDGSRAAPISGAVPDQMPARAPPGLLPCFALGAKSLLHADWIRHKPSVGLGIGQKAGVMTKTPSACCPAAMPPAGAGVGHSPRDCTAGAGAPEAAGQNQAGAAGAAAGDT